MNYPKSIQRLIDDLSQLPTVGPRTAERFVVHLLKQPQDQLQELAKHIYDLKNDVKVCSRCLALSETNPCEICSNEKRKNDILCIVSSFSEMLAIEATGVYNGLYYILGRNIRPQEGDNQEKIGVKKLNDRMKEGKIKEVILALSSTLEGETTSMYLTKLLTPYKVKVTKLARGLPMGSDIEYADEITLNDALKNRKEV